MARVILVLGGGGMKGIAHVGAWQAIEEAGIEVSEVVGTSIGALIGGCIAGGLGWRDLVPRALALEKQDLVTLNRWAVMPNGIRQKSVFLERTFRRFIEDLLPAQRFDALDRPLQVNAVDLEDGRMEWFGAGGRGEVPLAEAVYASCAVPCFWPPAKIDGRYYVDGGVVDAVPIDRAAERGADVVIAVDVAAGEKGDPLDAVSKGMIAIHHRVFEIMAYRRRRERLERWSGPPLIYVRPRVDRISTLDFTRTRYFLEEGYRATRQALADWERSGGAGIARVTVEAGD